MTRQRLEYCTPSFQSICDRVHWGHQSNIRDSEGPLLRSVLDQQPLLLLCNDQCACVHKWRSSSESRHSSDIEVGNCLIGSTLLRPLSYDMNFIIIMAGLRPQEPHANFFGGLSLLPMSSSFPVRFMSFFIYYESEQYSFSVLNLRSTRPTYSKKLIAAMVLHSLHSQLFEVRANKGTADGGGR